MRSFFYQILLGIKTVWNWFTDWDLFPEDGVAVDRGWIVYYPPGINHAFIANCFIDTLSLDFTDEVQEIMDGRNQEKSNAIKWEFKKL